MFPPDKVFIGSSGWNAAGTSRELGTWGLARQLSCQPFFPAGVNALLLYKYAWKKLESFVFQNSHMENLKQKLEEKGTEGFFISQNAHTAGDINGRAFGVKAIRQTHTVDIETRPSGGRDRSCAQWTINLHVDFSVGSPPPPLTAHPWSIARPVPTTPSSSSIFVFHPHWRPEKFSIGNYIHHRFIVRRAPASAILFQPSHISLRSGPSLGVETEHHDNPGGLHASFLAVASIHCALSVWRSGFYGKVRRAEEEEIALPHYNAGGRELECSIHTYR